MARAALILGIIAAVLAFIPGPSFVAFLPALTAVGLGIAALARRLPQRGFGVTGIVLGSIAFIAAVVVSTVAFGGTPVKTAVSGVAAPAAPSAEPSASAAPPPPPAVPADKAYTGTGDSVIKVELPDGVDSPSVATISHAGSRNFAVWSLDANLAQQDLLVNTIGSYKGTVLMDVRSSEHTSSLEITADGAWTVTLHSLKALREFTGASATGTGDDVLVYRGKAGAAAITNTGSGNFAVWTYGDSSDLVVNEIGAYTGTVRWGAGPSVISVTSDGNWSITVG